MKGTKNPNPPRIMLQAFRWFCHPDFQEEIEGDLLEQFHLNVEEHGLNQAKWHFVLDVLLLFRPEIMGNFFQLNTQFLPMSSSQWRKLIGINLAFVFFLLLRYVPGPPNQFVVSLSTFCFVGMTLGLLISPVNLAWGIIELQKQQQDTKSDLWSSGYRFGLLVSGITALFLVLALFFSLQVKAYFIIPSIALIAFLLAIFLPHLKKLRHTAPTRLNPAPFFMLTLPVVILLTHAYLVVPVNTYSRAYAIKKTEPLISAIETYKAKEGQYPTQMQDLMPKYLTRIPQPRLMGSQNYHYEKTAEAYTLSFKINLGETDELVVYNKNDQYEVKGHYTDFKAKEKHWRCFWMD